MAAEVHSEAVDALIAGYVGGRLPAPMRALVAAHLELSGRNRRYAGDLEAIAGDELSAIAPAPLGRREARLAEIFALEADPTPDPALAPLAPAAASAGLPPALRAYLGHDLDAVRWRTLLPGLREWRPAADDGGCVPRLLSIRGGLAVPHHTHHGIELTLVIHGAFSDSLGHHVAGDLVVADDEVDHRPVADPGEDCLCFTVTDAPLRLTGPVGRFLAPFVKF